MGSTIEDDKEMVRLLWQELAVDEIVDSISANGFFKEEPLVVIPKDPQKTDAKKDSFIVWRVIVASQPCACF